LLSGLAALYGIRTSSASSNNLIFSTTDVSGCPSQFFLHNAPNGTVILNVNWKVKNDEDSGLSGYWALDYYVTNLKVWRLTNGNFYVLKTYKGVFETPQGAVSPGNDAVAQNTSVYGTIVGGYNGTFSATFSPGVHPTSGYIGIKDYGGTLSDVLKGTYGNGQTGDSHVFDWETVYFTGFTAINFQAQWGWKYVLNSQFNVNGETDNTWCNYFSGTTGDITYPTF
jgi:hypothetical protein